MIDIEEEIGYGYLLRIISRNPNVRKGTLETIANDLKVEQGMLNVQKLLLKTEKIVQIIKFKYPKARNKKAFASFS